MRHLKLFVVAGAIWLAICAVAVAAATTAGPTPQAVSGNLNICKVASAPLAGQTFPIQVATWSGSFYKVYSLTAGASPGGCSGSIPFTAGTWVLVEEASSPGVPYPGVHPNFSLSQGSIGTNMPSLDLVAFQVPSGSTTLTITNTPIPPGQSGTIQVCKTAGDSYVNGQTFDYSLSGAGGFNATTDVLANQCNTVDNVPSGTPVSITEQAQFPYALSSVSALPSTSLLSSDLGTQNASVEVEPGQEINVFFTNDTLTGYVKVCKALDRAADDVLAGHTFNYTVSALPFNGNPVSIPGSVSVVAMAYPTSTCSFIGGNANPTALPLGTQVTVTEAGSEPASSEAVATSVSPANLDAGSTTGQAVLYVGNLPSPGNVGTFGAGSVTQANFTNEAFGSVEVCKTSNSINKGEPFNFTVAGSLISPVEVGFCSPGITLPVGTTTITEGAVNHVSLTSVFGTSGATLSGNTVTADVVYNTDNLVTFDNEVNTGTLKICKAQTSSDADLQNSTFNGSYSFSNGATGGTWSLEPGQCTLPINNVPIVTGALAPVSITVTENPSSIANAALYNLTVSGGDTFSSLPSLPHLLSTPVSGTLNSLEGISTVTFVNGIDNTPPT